MPELIADKLGVVENERVTAFTELGERRAEVHQIFEVPLTPACYAEISELQRILNISGFNVAVIKVMPNEEGKVKEKLKSMNILGVESKKDLMEDIESMMGFFWAFILFSLSFGASLGFAAIFNTTTVNILERRRELATLKMLGYTTRELALMLAAENLVVGIFGIAIGLPLGHLLSYVYLMSFQSELYYMPFRIFLRTYVIAAVLTVCVVIASLDPRVKYIANMEVEKVTKEVAS